MTKLLSSSSSSSRPYELQRELKSCQHYCYPSETLDKCCACEDKRPISASGLYETYVDGKGWQMTAARDDGYCPICNTKNYDKWMERIQKELERKKKERDERMAMQQEERDLNENDRLNHLHLGMNGRIEYSNGNIYVGDLLDGKHHGYGRMDYADNDDDILFYEGDWKKGKHEGKGQKVWMDNVRYDGEWKDGMMHGKGRYHVNEVDFMDGRFEEDVFQD